MLTGTFAERGKAIFSVGVPVAPGPNRAVDPDGEQQHGKEEAAAPRVDAADNDPSPLSARLLTMRAAFMTRLNKHMGVAAAAAAEEEEAEEEEG
jgi:hypothetical protein